MATMTYERLLHCRNCDTKYRWHEDVTKPFNCPNCGKMDKVFMVQEERFKPVADIEAFAKLGLKLFRGRHVYSSAGRWFDEKQKDEKAFEKWCWTELPRLLKQLASDNR